MVSYLAVTVIGLAVLSEAPAVHATLAAGPAQSIGVQAEAPLTGPSVQDQRTQDAAARKQIEKLFRGVDVHVAYRVETSPIRLGAAQAAKADAGSLVLLEDGTGVRGGIRIVTGEWPPVATGAEEPRGAPSPVAIQADAARRLGLLVGDIVTIPSSNGAVALRVAATWRVRDASAPIWFGDQRVATGRAEDALGPFVLGADVLARFDATPAAAWVVTPDAERTTPAEVPVLVDGFARLGAALGADDAVATAQVTVSGEGRQTALGMQQSMAALAAVLPLPLAVLGVGTVLALVLLARLTADTRAVETTLLRARGADGGLLIRVGVLESVVIGMVGAAIGAGLAALTLLLVSGALPSLALVLVPPALTALCVVVVQTGVVVGTVRAALGVAREAGRARAVASAGLALLVVLAAAFALWRFLQYTGPGGTLDAAAIAAPALALLAIALLGLVAFAPLARAFERAGSRSQRIGVTLPARQVGRGLGFFTAPVALVILAVAASVLGAGYFGTWSALNSSAALAVNAADVRVQTALAAPLRNPGDSVGASGYAALPGVSAAIPALQASAHIGEDAVTIVSAPTARLEKIEGSNSALLGIPGLQRSLPAAAAAEPTLPKGTTALTATVRLTGDAVRDRTTVSTTIWLCDDDGELVPVGADAVRAEPTVTTAALPVPAAAGSWHVVAVDTTLSGGGAADADTWALAGLRAQTHGSATSVPLTGDWRIVSDPFDTSPGVTADPSGFGFRAPALNATAGVTVRMMPGASKRPAIALTSDFAAASGLAVGDGVSVDGGWWAVDAVVADIVPMVPGESSTQAAFFDLGTLQRAVLRTTAAPAAANQVWASSSNPAAARAAVQHHAGPTATVTITETAFVDRFLAGAFVGLALGCLGCIALAVIALASATAALSRRRRAEVAVFRALGFTCGQQVRQRTTELWLIAAVAAVIGAAAGVAVTLLVAPGLARLTVVTAPAALPLSIVLDPLSTVLALALITAAVAAVVLAYGAGIRRQAADTGYREEAR